MSVMKGECLHYSILCYLVPELETLLQRSGDGTEM